jgi:cytochrome c oxidase cbb3-type subunit I
MGGFVSRSSYELTSQEHFETASADNSVAVAERPDQNSESSLLAVAAWHSLAWLVVANFVGVWLAVLLLYPPAGDWIGEWSYGRWMPVHLNFQLYGWISLPLVAWLLKIYQAGRGSAATWSRAALWMWSLALTLGALSWLNGHSSGKLFLDWTGYARVFFPMTILFLWFVLARAMVKSWQSPRNASRVLRVAKMLGLALLLPVPFMIYIASNPAIYPPINPDSGGPTGASQLESVLVIVLILFLLPYGISKRSRHNGRWIATGWIIIAIEFLLCFGLGREDVSHHRPTQLVSLGSLLVWVALVPAYYSAFVWNKNTRRWLIAALAWWAVLIPTGWSLFLPGILDHLKFTDGLVGHALMAMAGFATSLLILLLVVLLGEDGDVFNSGWAFIFWQGGTGAYALIMFLAGWTEGNNPTFTMVPSTTRNVIYTLRLLLGVAMTSASCNWLLRLTARIELNTGKRSGTLIEPQWHAWSAARYGSR